MSVSAEALLYQLPTELSTKLNELLSPLSYTDSSAVPGAATASTYAGKSAFAAGASSVVITNTLVGAASVVLAVISQTSADGTLLYVARVVPAAGSFTIYRQEHRPGTQEPRICPRESKILIPPSSAPCCVHSHSRTHTLYHYALKGMR